MIPNRCKFEKICLLRFQFYSSKLLPNKLLILCVINKYRIKQLMIFERTVVTASGFKNCTMINCGYVYIENLMLMQTILSIPITLLHVKNNEMQQSTRFIISILYNVSL